MLGEVVSRQRDQKRQEILDWLTPTDYTSKQADSFGRRQPGTGQWFLDSTEFKGWKGTSGQTLFCPGNPGVGKTILTSVVIDHLTTQFSADSKTVVAYIYFSFKNNNQQKLGDILAILLKQLSQGQPSLPEDVQKLFTKHRDQRSQPSVEELRQALMAVSTTWRKLFILVDGLDECRTSDGCQPRFVDTLLDIQEHSKANLFVTSRPIPEIVKNFQYAVSLEIKAAKADVGSYLDSQMGRLPECVKGEALLQEEIKKKIVEIANGM